MLRRFSSLIPRQVPSANQPATSGRNRPPASPAGQPRPDHPAAGRATLKQARAPFPSRRSQRRSSASTRCPISSRRTDRRMRGPEHFPRCAAALPK